MALSNLTKVQTLGIGSNIEVVGVITTGQFKSGTSNLHSTGVDLTNLNVSGIATIGGNLSVGGVLTYEDVTNIDSVGVVTAREGIFIPDNKKIHLGNASGSGDLQIYHTGAHSYIADEGVGELIISGSRVQLMNAARSGKLFDSVEGASGYLRLYQNNNIRLEATNTGATITGDITISDSIIHSGDTNTKIRFPANDEISLETSGHDRIYIKSNGSVGIGTDTPIGGLHLNSNGNNGISFRMENYEGYSSFHNDGGALHLDSGQHIFRNQAGSTEFARITSAGLVGINEASPDTKLHVKNGVLKIETETSFYSGSGENGENYASIFLNSNHSSGNNPAHGKITVRHSNQNTYSGDLVLMPQGYYSGSYGYQEVLRVSAYKRVGINEPSPSAELDVQGDGAPVNINSSNSNSFKIAFEDNGTVRGYLGCDNTNLLNVGNSSAASKFVVNTAGVAHNLDTSTHGSGVFMCEVHTDLLALLKSSQNHGNNTGMYYSWPDGGGASWTWDNGVLRMDSNVGSHSWQCGAVHLTPGYYTLMQCWRASPDAHGWSNFGSNSNGNGYYLTTDAAYGSYNTLLTSYAGQAPRNDGKTYWYGTTTGNFWYNVTSAGTYRIQQMGQPYGSGGYKYYILAAYLLKLK